MADPSVYKNISLKRIEEAEAQLRLAKIKGIKVEAAEVDVLNAKIEHAKFLQENNLTEDLNAFLKENDKIKSFIMGKQTESPEVVN